MALAGTSRAFRLRAGGDGPDGGEPLRRAHRSARDALAEVGAPVVLTARAARAAVAPPYDYRLELLLELAFIFRITWFPLGVSAIALSYGALGVQIGDFATLLGEGDRLGGLFGMFGTRELAPFVTGVVVAGAAGTAICADLGSRRIRQELDALEVLGVDLVKHLVAPRLVALVIATPILDVFAQTLMTNVGGPLAALSHRVALGSYLGTLLSSAPGVTDLWAAVVKTAVFGAIIGAVCCHKGLAATRGPEGVGRAVNQAIVIATVSIFAFNYVFTQALLALNPEFVVSK